MNLNDVLATVPPCNVQQPHLPFWRCDLPRGHAGNHASLALRHFEA